MSSRSNFVPSSTTLVDLGPGPGTFVYRTWELTGSNGETVSLGVDEVIDTIHHLRAAREKQAVAELKKTTAAKELIDLAQRIRAESEGQATTEKPMPTPAAEKEILDAVQRIREERAKPTITQTLTADATDAAWRTAASQIVKLVRDPLAALLCRHLGTDDPAMRARVAAFLQTELGTAILASLLSLALAALPAPAGSQAERVNGRIARELRVKAMADAGDVIAELLMGPLRDVMSLYLSGVPEMSAPAALPEATRASVATVVSDEAKVG